MSDATHRRTLEAIRDRERIVLGRYFAPQITAALDDYLGAVLLIGYPTDTSRRKLVDALAPYGLADPDGRGRFTPSPPRSVEDAHATLPKGTIDLEEFRATVASTGRASVAPVDPEHVARLIAAERRNTRSGAFSGPLWIAYSWSRSLRWKKHRPA